MAASLFIYLFCQSLVYTGHLHESRCTWEFRTNQRVGNQKKKNPSRIAVGLCEVREFLNDPNNNKKRLETLTYLGSTNQLSNLVEFILGACFGTTNLTFLLEFFSWKYVRIYLNFEKVRNNEVLKYCTSKLKRKKN